MVDAPASQAQLPAHIGPYRVLARIASGGMAEIYVATRVGAAGFERAVVIKRMLPHLAGEPDLRDALLDEARLMARLRHPNIVGVQELRRDAGELFLVMEYLRGDNLAGLRRAMRGRSERLDPALAAHVIADLCAGLHAAHELTDDEGRPLHVVHRDVSPQNVFVTFDGEVKLIDFGIACFEHRAGHTKTGMTKGKFSYMSPEHFSGERLDRRTDVFAAGALLHELLTGKRLFARETEAQVLRAVLNDPIPLPSQVADDDVLVPEALDDICMRALERDRDLRFASADEMRVALRDLMPALDPRQRARERLIELTRRVLPHRFAESEILMRRASLEADGPPAPSPEAPTRTEVPRPTPSGEIAIDVVVAGDERPTRAGRPSRMRRPSARARALAIGGGTAVLLAAGISLAATIAPGARDPRARPPDSLAASPARTPVEPSPEQTAASRASTDTDPAVPARAQVALHVESDPPGATVRVGARVVGTTPLELELETSSAPVELVIERAGHATARHTIVPDADQRVLVHLEEDRRRALPRFYSFD